MYFDWHPATQHQFGRVQASSAEMAEYDCASTWQTVNGQWPCAGYNTAVKGTPTFNGSPDPQSDCLFSDLDSFFDAPYRGADHKERTLANDPFADLDEELPWLETVTDFSTVQDISFNIPSPLSDLEQISSQVNWDEWDRFLCEKQPDELVDLSRVGSPLPPVDNYVPHYDSSNTTPFSTAPHSPSTLPEDMQILEDLIQGEAQKASKPRRTKQSRRPYPAVIDDEQSNPSDIRRRALNRDAAYRYRERKKAEKEAIFVEAKKLEDRNTWLHSRVSLLTREISRMRTQLQEMSALELC